MQRVFIWLKRKPGITFTQFRHHYETSHAKLGEKYFGHLFASYRRNYTPQGRRFSDGATAEAYYDCLTEIVFKDPEGYLELRRLAALPEIRRVLDADELLFLDKGACRNIIPEPVESDLSALAAE